MITQEETRNVSRVLYHEWYPQIVFNHHQTAPFPARIFIPPFADPVNPHIPPLVVRGVNMVGEHMAKRIEEEGMPGVVSRMTFTMWWNGGMRTVPYFKNMVGLLSEVGHASATPQYHDPEGYPSTSAPARTASPPASPASTTRTRGAAAGPASATPCATTSCRRSAHWTSRHGCARTGSTTSTAWAGTPSRRARPADRTRT
jgi:hypothetical protein